MKDSDEPVLRWLRTSLSPPRFDRDAPFAHSSRGLWIVCLCLPAHIGLLLPGMQCVNVGINKAEVGRQFRSFDGSLECLDALALLVSQCVQLVERHERLAIYNTWHRQQCK